MSHPPRPPAAPDPAGVRRGPARKSSVGKGGAGKGAAGKGAAGKGAAGKAAAGAAGAMRDLEDRQRSRATRVKRDTLGQDLLELALCETPGAPRT